MRPTTVTGRPKPDSTMPADVRSALAWRRTRGSSQSTNRSAQSPPCKMNASPRAAAANRLRRSSTSRGVTKPGRARTGARGDSVRGEGESSGECGWRPCSDRATHAHPGLLPRPRRWGTGAAARLAFGATSAGSTTKVCAMMRRHCRAAACTDAGTRSCPVCRHTHMRPRHTTTATIAETTPPTLWASGTGAASRRDGGEYQRLGGWERRPQPLVAWQLLRWRHSEGRRVMRRREGWASNASLTREASPWMVHQPPRRQCRTGRPRKTPFRPLPPGFSTQSRAGVLFTVVQHGYTTCGVTLLPPQARELL